MLLTGQIARWLTLPPMQTSLTCLDLSFNCIATIPVGLDRLTRLVDLSLFANKICTLESMTALRGLEILSLGALLSSLSTCFCLWPPVATTKAGQLCGTYRQYRSRKGPALRPCRMTRF